MPEKLMSCMCVILWDDDVVQHDNGALYFSGAIGCRLSGAVFRPQPSHT